MSQFETVYKKYRSADDDAGDLGWAARHQKRAVWISGDETIQRQLAALELSAHEKAVAGLLKLPRMYVDVETCGLLDTKQMRRFLRALHAAEILELQDADKAKALVPLEIKRARATAEGKAPAPSKKPHRKRLRAKVYRPAIEGVSDGGDLFTSDASAASQAVPSDAAAPEVAPQDGQGQQSSEDCSFEKEINEVYARKRRSDYFDVLDLTRTASTDEIKKAYLDLAKRYHPDRLAGRVFQDPVRAEKQMQTLFARIGDAYRELQKDDSRRAYLEKLDAGLVSSDVSGEMRRRPAEAQIAFKKGLVFLQKKDILQARRMFAMARDLDHSDSTFTAHLAWCEYLDERKPRESREQKARAHLQRVIDQDPKAAAFYFLGMIFKLGGDERAAVTRFREALKLDPKHAEAAREVRLADMRQDRVRREQQEAKSRSSAKGGLLDRFLKK